ncbi:MAG: DNA polymerase III subunit alpha [Candidatus Delongbacteria bacterium]|nr:DNA polymerase III subunit alpha [Candidatus Delongbacteria bacterium]
MSFVHLHNHSHYSLLDGLSKPADMVKKAKEYSQPAIALTDHGNMMGTIDFVNAAKKADVKPIIGSEVYITKDDVKIKNKDNRYYHLVLLVKDNEGYENLMYLLSQAYLVGFYSKPRIDREMLKAHSKGLIGLSACLAGEIPQAVLNGDFQEAREIAKWYREVFGEDHFYLEVQHHPELTDEKIPGKPAQDYVNNELIKIGKELGIGLVATNDSHYVNYEDNLVQDALICVNTGSYLNERENRMSMMNGNYSILSTDDMVKNFSNVPEAISNSLKIADMIKYTPEMGRNLVPVYNCPNGMSEEQYLRHLAYNGLEQRYGIIRKEDGNFFLKDGVDEAKLVKPMTEIIERTEFEIGVILHMGYPGYFLIVQDFINWAKDHDILVGPGRGSAAGALIAYLLKITNIDPLRYDLLFERFLNPDRISMPDIDIDFQDDKRELVIDYVRNKYGHENVCQVVTYQTMGAKNSVKDIGRVMQVPLPIVDEISKAIPGKPGTTLKKTIDNEQPFVALYEKNAKNKELIDLALRIEGTIRGTGTHACAVIISGEPVYKYAPLMYPPKDEKTVISQYEGPQLESIGLLKMDFLGLRNLSIIANCLRFIEENYNIKLDIDNIPLDDQLTFKVYSDGLTDGIFQFESAGMKKFLKQLKPDRFDDLVAMNALYRPGPMENIPSFIARKHGKEEISYLHPLMEQYLDVTYGHTVYQEQVMLLSRLLANFTRGDSDTLRKAMGKKNKELMDKLKAKFVEGCKSNPEFVEGFKQVKEFKTMDELIEKIWTGWEEFAKYAFNKSHSVCYAYVSYQTAYLKAHYPVEYMSAMLESVADNSDKVVEYISECTNLGIEVVPPDVNYSDLMFSPTKDKKISFGMKGIKNVGEIALTNIVEERKKSGQYRDIYDFMDRIDLTKSNKRVLEFLTKSGALDSLGHKRSQIITTLDDLLSYYQQKSNSVNNMQDSLFGDSLDIFIDPPKLADIDEWDLLERLAMEKEFVGRYISGHPLDPYKEVLQAICFRTKVSPQTVNNNGQIKVGGQISKFSEITTKKGSLMAKLNLTTFYDEVSILLFPKTYEKLKGRFRDGDVGVFTVKTIVKDEDSGVDLFCEDYFSYEDASKFFGERTTAIKIKIRASQIDKSFQKDLTDYLLANSGEKPIIFSIATDDETFDLLPETIKVNGSYHFITGLKNIVGKNNVEIRF